MSKLVTVKIPLEEGRLLPYDVYQVVSRMTKAPSENLLLTCKAFFLVFMDEEGNKHVIDAGCIEPISLLISVDNYAKKLMKKCQKCNIGDQT